MSFWNPDTSKIEHHNDKGNFKMLWRLSILFSAVFLCLAAIFINFVWIQFLIYFSVLIVSLTTIAVLHITKKYKFAFWSYTLSATTLLLFSFFYIPTIHYPDFFWIVSVIMFAFIGLGRKIGLLFVLVFAIGLITFFYFRLNDHLTHLRIQTKMELASITIELLFAMIVLSYLLFEYLKLQQYSEQQLSLINQELAAQNQLVHQKNSENEVLIKEVHHRVKNNLQIIVSLLRMQMEEVESKETKVHFEDAISRVLTMSLIHQKLYQENQLASLDAQKYFTRLTQEIIESSSTDVKITFEINSNVSNVGLKTIVPIGLLINELISNSIKHAFTEQESGTIYIDFRETSPSDFVLNYTDTGTWKHNSIRPSGFGSELIKMLTQQLEGEFQRTDGSYQFQLKNLD